MAIVLTLVAINVWVRYCDWSTYQNNWSNGDSHYVDTHRHRDNQLIHRRLTVYESEEARQNRGQGCFLARGPMAGSGKPHGQWEWTFWKPKLGSTTRFYWYGDVVSEGEWHLRNK